MTRHQIYDEWAAAGCVANGAFFTDDELMVAYNRWADAGRPQRRNICMSIDGDRSRLVVTFDELLIGAVVKI